MLRHTQTIHRQIADELFECVSRFCEIDAYKVKVLKALKFSALLMLESRAFQILGP